MTRENKKIEITVRRAFYDKIKSFIDNGDDYMTVAQFIREAIKEKLGKNE